VVLPISGEFEGPASRVDPSLTWWFKTIVPTQAPDPTKSTLSFVGELRLTDGILTPIRIDHGAYDMYSGGIGWLTEPTDGRMIAGRVADDGTMQLVWQGAAVYGTELDPSGPFTYARTAP
jgi:hypothetical protein